MPLQIERVLDRVTRTGRRVATEFSEKNVPFMAAGIAYNAFISLAPLLIVLLLAVSTVGGGLEDRVVEIANSWMPGPIADVVAEVFEGDDSAPGASVVGLVVLVWGTLKIFRGLDTAFSEIYETTADNSFLDQLVDALVVLVAILVAVILTVATTSVFAWLEGAVPFIGAVTPLVLVVGLVVAFLPMYYRFPDQDVSLRNVLPGVVFAAVGWAIFQSLFQVYLAFSGGDSGSFFGGVIVVITWLYFSGIVLLLGAVINSVVGGHASGKAGGVGQGASSYETERERDLDVREISEYLELLRSDLTRGPVGARESIEDGGHRRYPLPDGRVRVIEQSKETDDGDEWSVVLSWEARDESSVGSELGVGSRADSAGATPADHDGDVGTPGGPDAADD